MATDRNGLTVLTVDECLRLLTSHVPRVGRIAFVPDGRPVILPVNYLFHEGSVVFRSDPGSKMAAASACEHVAFEVDAIDPTWEEGWSVLVQGRGEQVTDPEELEHLEALPLRPWAPGAKAAYVRISSTQISGRRIE
ncbi:MAG: pyridoxamine 5'-phosphate oxidase family protein [Nitriliruptorales bacterium]|nr:pyridoxamine 5'-phosphate oxidase family protein [Nitriliruptorales bacterium]